MCTGHEAAPPFVHIQMQLSTQGTLNTNTITDKVIYSIRLSTYTLIKIPSYSFFQFEIVGLHE